MKYLFLPILLATQLAFSYTTPENYPDLGTTPIEREKPNAYCSFGIGPLPLPAIEATIGARPAMSENNAFDIGITLSSVIAVNLVKVHGNIIHYFDSEKDYRFFIGGGGAGGVLFYPELYGGPVNATGYVAPSFIFGTEFKNSHGKVRLFQIEGNYPIAFLKDDIPFPLVSVKYGVFF